MNLTPNIFNVSAVSFDQGEKDPFGFDDFSGKIGADFLPFTGTVSKPAYFLFVAYVDRFLNANKSLWRNDREKRAIQIRLEKLLVYCWKKSSRDNSELLRGSSILGNSFELKDIDVYSGKGWVIQNAFKIYTDKNFAQDTSNGYWEKIGEKQMPLLLKFITNDYKQPKRKVEFLNEITKQLMIKNSLFNNHRLEYFKGKFKQELKEKIKNKHKEEHFQLVQPFFANNTFHESEFWSKLLESSNPKLPFAFLNNWFGKFVLAVNADVYDLPNRKSLWVNADKAFDQIPKRFLSNSKSAGLLQKRMKPRKWFQFKSAEYRYSFYDKGSPSEKRRIEGLWESYIKRQGEVNGTKYFFNYRHEALLRLLKELR